MALPAISYVDADITNPAVSLTDWGVLVDLSLMPQTEFWDEVDTSDPTKFRFADGNGNELPFDVFDYDQGANEGVARVKWSLSDSGTQTLRIYPAKSSTTSYAEGDTYGKHNAYNNESYWPLGGGSDRTSNSNDGTTNGGVTVGGVSGKLSAATSFDGSDDFVSLDVNKMPGAEDFTVSCWFKTNTAQIGTFVLWGDPTLNEGVGLGINNGSGEEIEFIIWNNAFKVQQNYADGQWHHAVGVYDHGAGEVELYLDGTSIGTKSVTLDPGTSWAAIGANPYSGGVNHYQGDLHEVRVLNTAWSSDEVQYEYDQTNNNSGHFTSWGGGSTTTLQDKTINQHSGVTYWEVDIPTSDIPGAAAGDRLDSLLETELRATPSGGSTVELTAYGLWWGESGGTTTARYYFSSEEAKVYDVEIVADGSGSTASVSSLHGLSGQVTVQQHNPNKHLKRFTSQGGRVANVDGEAIYFYPQEWSQRRMDCFGGFNGLQNWQGNEAAWTTEAANGAKSLGTSIIYLPPFGGIQFRGLQYDNQNLPSAPYNPDIEACMVWEKIMDQALSEDVHVYWKMWSDSDSNMSPNQTGGINGTADTRFMKWVGAWLSAYPNHSVYLGTDMQEDWTSDEVEQSLTNFNSKALHDNFFTARGFAAESGVTVQSGGSDDWTAFSLPMNNFSARVDDFNNTAQIHGLQMYKADDTQAESVAEYMDYANLRAMCDDATLACVATDNIHPTWPDITGSTDFTEDRMRRAFCRGQMAGGFTWSFGKGTQYTNPEWFYNVGTFFNKFLRPDLSVDNGLVTTSGYGMKSSADGPFIMYEENTNSIGIDLSGASSNIEVRAVNVQDGIYEEQVIGTYSPGTYTLGLDATADWLVYGVSVGGDTTKPTVQSASIASNGTTLTLGMSETVDFGSNYDRNDWTVNVDGSPVSVTGESGGNSSSLTLTLGSTVQQGDSVTLDWTGGSGDVVDNAGNYLDPFSGRNVTNNSTQGGTSGGVPELLSATITSSGSFMEVTFSEAVSAGGAYDRTDWQCLVNGQDLAIFGSAQNQTIWGFNLGRSVDGGDSVTLRWTGTTDGIVDADGNDLPDTGTIDVVNNSGATGDTTAPVVTSASINAAGDELTVQFSEAVEGTTNSGGDMNLTVNAAAGPDLNDPTGSGTSTLVFPLAAGETVFQGESVNLAYSQPGGGITDTSSNANELESFSNFGVTNNSTQAESTTITDTVTLGGSPVEGAIVSVIDPTTGQTTQTVTTKKSGEYTVAVEETSLLVASYQDTDGTWYTSLGKFVIV